MSRDRTANVLMALGVVWMVVVPSAYQIVLPLLALLGYRRGRALRRAERAPTD